MTRLQHTIGRFGPLLLLAGLALVVAACTPFGQPAGSPGASPSFSQAPLTPVQLGGSWSPVDILAWLFNPIFQLLFILLTVFDTLTSNMVVAIILLTIAMRVAVIPLYRRQLVTTRQTQLIQPEIKELQRKYKGDRVKSQQAVSEYYKQRGINPAAGCLPILLQFGLLIPMYSVISQGLTNYNVSAMLQVFGFDLGAALGVVCDAAPVFNQYGHVTNPCLNPVAFGINWGLAEPWTTGLWLTGVGGFGISILAIISSLVQLVASRMTLPAADPKNDDPNLRIQRQMAYFLPLISILYGGALPAGLFIYWITATLIQIVQQYLILGWGGMFPLFGWFPEFARNHTPRFPVKLPEPKPILPGQSTGAAERSKTVDRDLSAQSTIRRNRQRSSRRGRRR